MGTFYGTITHNPTKVILFCGNRCDMGDFFLVNKSVKFNELVKALNFCS